MVLLILSNNIGRTDTKTRIKTIQGPKQFNNVGGQKIWLMLPSITANISPQEISWERQIRTRIEADMLWLLSPEESAEESFSSRQLFLSLCYQGISLHGKITIAIRRFTMLIFSWSTLASLSAMLMTKCYLLSRKLMSLKELSHSAYFRKNVAESS